MAENVFITFEMTIPDPVVLQPGTVYLSGGSPGQPAPQGSTGKLQTGSRATPTVGSTGQTQGGGTV